PCPAHFASREQEKCHAVPKGPKRKSSRTSARGAQSDDQAHAELVGGQRRVDRTQVIALAEEGDIAAIRVCVDRLAPALKGEPVDIQVAFLDNAGRRGGGVAEVGVGGCTGGTVA